MVINMFLECGCAGRSPAMAVYVRIGIKATSATIGLAASAWRVNELLPFGRYGFFRRVHVTVGICARAARREAEYRGDRR
jgi:hypothetical protein